MKSLIIPPTPDKDAKHIAKLVREIQRGNLAPENISAIDVPLLYRKDVLEEIIDSMKKQGPRCFLCDFGKQLGQPFIELLKSKAEQWRTKSVQNPADVVWALAGATENEWYLSLLKKDVNQVVKLTAIEALQGSMENTALLIDIYKHGKAAEKRAALTALAAMNPPEAEPIWKKMIEKGKKEFLYYVLKCDNQICQQYRKEQLEVAIESLFAEEENNICNKIKDVMHLCYVIPEEETLFLRIAQAKFGHLVNVNLNRNLIYNLHRESGRELTRRLYDKEPEYFFLANHFLNLIENPVDSFLNLTDISIEKRKEFLEVIAEVVYTPYRESYFSGALPGWPYPRYLLFQELPDSLLNFLSDDTYLHPATIGSPEYSMVYECAEKACNALWRLSSKERISEKDVYKAQSVAESFAVKVALAGYTGIFCMQIIGRNPDILKGKSKGILTSYAFNELMTKPGPFTRFHEIKMLALMKEEKLSELHELLERMCKETGAPADAPIGAPRTSYLTNRGGTIYWLKRTIEEIEQE